MVKDSCLLGCDAVYVGRVVTDVSKYFILVFFKVELSEERVKCLAVKMMLTRSFETSGITLSDYTVSQLR